MKKAIFLMLAGVLLLASCVRKDDLEMLRSPMHISGQMDPQFGFPVASGTMTLQDILNLWNGADRYIDSTAADGFITIKFDTILENNVDFTSKKSRGRKYSNRKGDFVFDTIIRGEQEINFFNDQDILDDVTISNLIVNWTADLHANASSQMQQLAADHGVQLTLDQVRISAVGRNNQNVVVDVNQGNALDLNELFVGDTLKNVHVLTDEDVAQIASIAPKKITYQARLHMVAGEAFFGDPMSYMVDSLEIYSIDIKNYISARFPLNLSVNYMAHNVDTVAFSLGDQLDSIFDQFQESGMELTVEEAAIKLRIDNGLPFTIGLHAALLDQSGAQVCVVADSATTKINAAPIVPSQTNPSIYVTNGTTRSVITLPVDQEMVENMKKATHVAFTICGNTAYDGASHPCVAPRRTDAVQLKMYVKVHPKVEIDIPINGLTNNGGNE